MKFIKNPEIIDAVPFEWGMEDGVKRFNTYIEKDAYKYPEHLRSTKYEGYLVRHEDILDSRCFNFDDGYVPYILSYPHNNMIRVKETDYVCINSSGIKILISSSELENNYKPLTEETQNG
jgi:hypothetical protein